MKPYLLVSTRPEEEALDSEYQAYVRATGLDREQLELAEFDLVGLPPIDPALYSGIFVAGSPYAGTTGHISQRLLWVREQITELLEELLAAETPLLVTGDAVTMLTEALGGSVSAEDGELGEIADIELTREALEDPLTKSLPPVFPAYSNHAEAVSELPEGAVRLARSLNTHVEIYRWGDRVYSVQFNPELDAESISAQIQAYVDAGDSGMGDVESLVGIGRHSTRRDNAGNVLRNFAEHFRQDD